LPAATRPESPFRVLVTHSDHVTATLLTTVRGATKFSSVQVMKSGVSVIGKVLSRFGRPVCGATVVVARAPWDGTFLRLTTDNDGRFRSGRIVDPNRPGLVLLVQAPGLAWVVHHVVPRN
jgi:hypothetical protein